MLIPKPLTLGPRDPRIGDRPSPWGEGERNEGFSGLHAPQINQPSASRAEVRPQKAITALGTLNLDRLHSFSADSGNKDRAYTSHYNSGKNSFFFLQIEYTYKGGLIMPSHNEKCLMWIKATGELLTVQFRWLSGLAYIMCRNMLIMSRYEMRERFCTSEYKWSNLVKYLTEEWCMVGKSGLVSSQYQIHSRISSTNMMPLLFWS